METKSCLSLIMAAGEGTRMNSNIPKVLHQVAGKAMIDRVLDVCPPGPQPVVIVGHGRQAVEEHVGTRARFAVQEEQKGTGHAVMMARTYLEQHEGMVLVLAGDMPLLTKDVIDALVQQAQGKKAALLSSMAADPTGYGRILRDAKGDVCGIVEQKDATEEQREIREVNASVYVFDAKALLDCLDALTCDNAQGEYYLTDCIALLAQKGEAIGSVTAEEETCLGVNNRVQLAQAEAVVRRRVNETWMHAGVTLIDPAQTYIDETVQIGRDSVIYPGVMLQGRTTIGAGCMIMQGCRIVDSEIGDGTDVQNSVLIEAKVGAQTHIGPFAYLRPGSIVGNACKIGDFVELKNMQVGDRSKLPHLTYAGDGTIGTDCNIACGTIFVNYDGKVKQQTHVGNHCFVGCNVNLIAPAEIGDGAYIAAGSTVVGEVPGDSLCIGRAHADIKEEWAKRRREQGRLK